jgi:hypothetical protein
VRIDITQRNKLSFLSKSALRFIEFYTNSLIVEWNRIMEDNENHWKIMENFNVMKDIKAGRISAQWSDRLDLDIHFYLICWDKINKYFDVLQRNESGNECIKSAWDEINNLTEKASRARDFYEHLADNLTETYSGNPLGHSMASDGSFLFNYSDLSNKGVKFERQLTLGRQEVEKVMKAYEKVLKCLGAQLDGYPTDTVGELPTNAEQPKKSEETTNDRTKPGILQTLPSLPEHLLKAFPSWLSRFISNAFCFFQFL